MGAFLQSLIYGFAGLKIRPHRLEFFRPIPPPMHSKMVLNNFKYLNNNLTITIEEKKVTVEILSHEIRFPLELMMNDSAKTKIPLKERS